MISKIPKGKKYSPLAKVCAFKVQNKGQCAPLRSLFVRVYTSKSSRCCRGSRTLDLKIAAITAKTASPLASKIKFYRGSKRETSLKGSEKKVKTNSDAVKDDITVIGSVEHLGIFSSQKHTQTHTRRT